MTTLDTPAADRLGAHLRETGGGWWQCWDTPKGYSVLVYRNGDGNGLHAGGHGETPSEAIVAALAQMGVEP